ncbi:hypothetical protein C8D87_12115 [Lentzea atacamensis]|uniref:Uncharacterized protein n=1 Tax=Lentzea atacamensis TaxID=531938 RepID=A0ABX9DUD7_9PSEU|nr:hypothetical protein [Lentzea atacamensis]RAS57832.1 hypothetical protein C8D87_12115 [Lentzea atacamensis]
MMWLAALFAFCLYPLASRLVKRWKPLKKLWWLPYVILAVAIFALSAAPLPFGWGTVGGLAAKIVKWPMGLLAGWWDISVAWIAGPLLVLVIIAGLLDLFADKKADGFARIMLITAPVLALIATGPIASGTQEVVDTVGGVGPAVVEKVNGS